MYFFENGENCYRKLGISFLEMLEIPKLGFQNCQEMLEVSFNNWPRLGVLKKGRLVMDQDFFLLFFSLEVKRINPFDLERFSITRH